MVQLYLHKLNERERKREKERDRVRQTEKPIEIDGKIERKEKNCLAHGTLLSYVAAWMGGEFGGEWIHVCVWLSLFAVHLKLSQHY